MNAKNLYWSGVALVVALAAGPVQAEEARSMLTGDVVVHEVSQVEVVLDSSGEVVQIRVDGCETCQQQSFLPARGLSVSVAGRPVSGGQLSRVNGQGGNVVENVGTGMARSVDFWSVRGVSGGEK